MDELLRENHWLKCILAIANLKKIISNDYLDTTAAIFCMKKLLSG